MYERPFTLNCTHWVFMLFFFSYAPLVQFLTDSFPGQADVGAFEAVGLKTNGILLLWCACYSLTYYAVTHAQLKRKPPVLLPPELTKPNYPWLVLFCLACTALAVVTTGLSGLLRLTASGSNGVELSSSTGLLVGTISRSCPLGCMIIMLVTGRRNQPAYYMSLVIVAACALLTNFPLTMTRFLEAAIVINYICLTLRRQRMTSLWLLLVFWLGFIVAMPFLNLFRLSSVQGADYGSLKQQTLQSVVTGGDFDAYMMMVATVSFGQKPDSITMGRQLVGNVLFFVPRNMWPDKPGGSGTLAVQNTVLNFYNLSEPLPAEGYVNFGVLGVMLFAGGFSWILGGLDKRYWTDMAWADRMRPNLLAITYPLLVGLVIFIMRGSLLASFAYSMGLVGACWISLNFVYIGSSLQKHLKKTPKKPLESPYAHQPAAPFR